MLCEVIEGERLKSRKGVNFPNLNVRLPSLTEKDLRDLDFGLTQGVDWISQSFVRCAEDVRILRRIIHEKGYNTTVIAKIEKPQAIENIEEILDEVSGIMVARGDLGVDYRCGEGSDDSEATDSKLRLGFRLSRPLRCLKA